METVFILVLAVVFLTTFIGRSPKAPRETASYAPDIPTKEEIDRQREQEWLAEMRINYPIKQTSDGKRIIQSMGKNNTVTYQVLEGQTELEAYQDFKRVSDLIAQEKNIYGEF